MNLCAPPVLTHTPRNAPVIIIRKGLSVWLPQVQRLATPEGRGYQIPVQPERKGRAFTRVSMVLAALPVILMASQSPTLLFAMTIGAVISETSFCSA